MYKVFFKDRTLFLTEKPNQELIQTSDAVHMHSSHHELQNFIKTFEQDEQLKTGFIYGRKDDLLLTALKKCYRFITAAGGLVIHPENKILVIRRLGVYDLPKGKCEKGESFRKTALREVEEECGLQDLAIRYPLLSTFHTYEQNGIHYLKETAWFFMDYFGFDEPTPQEEENIVSAEWVNKADLKNILNNTYPSIREVFNKAGY